MNKEPVNKTIKIEISFGKACDAVWALLDNLLLLFYSFAISAIWTTDAPIEKLVNKPINVFPIM